MTRRILPLALAVVLAILGTLAVVMYVRSADSRALAGKSPMSVLIAAKRIPAGTTGQQVRAGGYVTVVRMPANSVPGDVLRSVPEGFDELVVTSVVQPRQLVLRGVFGEKEAVNDVTSALPIGKNMVAVSVEVEVARQVAGYVRPGSKIAIFDTFTIGDAKTRTPSGDGLSRGPFANQVTRMLLTGIEVAAIGPYGSAGGTTAAAAAAAAKVPSGTPSKAAATTTKAPPVSTLVTLAVTQAQAERLIHGAQTGSLYLALLDDPAAIRPGPGVDNRSLFVP